MTRSTILAVLLVLALGCFASARGATEVKMVGDMRMYGSWHQNHNFTGWNPGTWTADSPNAYVRAGTRTEDTFMIWERFRLRADFVANETLKFRLGLRVEDIWGRGTFTAANPTPAVDVYLAYLQFKWPSTDIEITAGLQQIDLPQSTIFFNSPVWGGERITGLTVNIPVTDKSFRVLLNYLRLVDINRTYDPTTTQVGDEFDAYVLSLPVTLDDFKVNPWGMAAVVGQKAALWSSYMGPGQLGAYMGAPGALVSPTGWKNNQNAYYWFGSSFELKSLSPVNLYADITYGAGAQNDSKKNRRAGWMVDFGAEYTGWDLLTPQVFGWYSSGEDDSIRNGSERLPLIKPNWGAGNSWLFDTDLSFPKDGCTGNGMSPAGNWGVGASLQNLSFVERLTHRLTATYVRGTNSSRAIRALNTLVGSNPYFTMGRELTTNEYVLGVNFDHKYQINSNLNFEIESGWAHGQFQESVWGRRLTRKAEANGNNEWKVAFGFMYSY